MKGRFSLLLVLVFLLPLAGCGGSSVGAVKGPDGSGTVDVGADGQGETDGFTDADGTGVVPPGG